MALLPPKDCPTLAAADAALVTAQERRTRAYLGMSALGNECARALWYGFRWTRLADFDAPTLKRFADGHAVEDVIVKRLQATPNLELHAVDTNGEQFGFKDLGGHLSGHMDGVVRGLIQAPTTWHVFEAKATAEKKLAELRKLVRDVGEKMALRAWNAVYYAQAVLYMHYAELTRHYTVVTSPGARDWTALRTDADPAEAQALIAKAERIVFSDAPSARIGGPDSFACKWCDFAPVCHAGEPADRNCRTCMHVTPEPDGQWTCARFGHFLSTADQRAGCPEQRFNPALVAGEQVDATHASIIYRRADGSRWEDRGPRQ